MKKTEHSLIFWLICDFFFLLYIVFKVIFITFMKLSKKKLRYLITKWGKVYKSLVLKSQRKTIHCCHKLRVLRSKQSKSKQSETKKIFKSTKINGGWPLSNVDEHYRKIELRRSRSKKVMPIITRQNIYRRLIILIVNN